MKGPVGFGRATSIVMNLILGVSISIVMLAAISAPVTIDAVIGSWFASFCIGFTLGELVPIASAGPAICAALKIRSRFVSYAVNSIVLGFCFGTVILLGMAIVNTLGASGWNGALGFFVQFWPLIVVSAIGLMLASLWLAQAIAKSVSGFDPEIAGDQA